MIDRKKGIENILIFLTNSVPKKYKKYIGISIEPAQLITDIITIGSEFAIQMIYVLHRMSDSNTAASQEFFNMLIVKLIYRANEEGFLAENLKKQLEGWIIPENALLN